MKPTNTSLWLAIAIAVLGSGCAKDASAPTERTVATGGQLVSERKGEHDDDKDKDKDKDKGDEGDDDEGRAVTYALIGDVPYEPRTPSALSVFPNLIQSINSDPDVTRAIHLGDIKSGSTECSDAWFQTIYNSFTTFADPLVYLIGDNEWTDCHRANNGGYNPINRLNAIRALFFANPGYTLGGVHKRIDAQRNYPENQAWRAAKVQFAAFHIIGSNNGRDPWFGDRVSPVGETPAETAAREAEYIARNAANIAWLETTFKEAREEHAVGVVLLLQADLWHPADRAAGAKFTAHQAWLARLATLATQFGKPVLMVAGDSHDFRVDVGVPWFSLYGLTPPANITQIIVDRSIEADIDWVKLTIDPKSATLFSWTQIFVP